MNLSIAMVTTPRERAMSGSMNQPPCVSNERKLIPVLAFGCDSADAGGAVCGGINTGAIGGVKTVALTAGSVSPIFEVIKNIKIPKTTV